jgi:hypothetical protein
MQDRRALCQAAMALVALLGAAATGCRRGGATAHPDDGLDPYCAATLEAASRAPSLASAPLLAAQARARGEEGELTRLAARACPFGWVSARGTADAALARLVLERCADAEAVLALACAARGRLEPEDAEAVAAWARRHPVARADDGPAITHARARLATLEGAAAAREALGRVSFPSR